MLVFLLLSELCRKVKIVMTFKQPFRRVDFCMNYAKMKIDWAGYSHFVIIGHSTYVCVKMGLGPLLKMQVLPHILTETVALLLQFVFGCLLWKWLVNWWNANILAVQSRHKKIKITLGTIWRHNAVNWLFIDIFGEWSGVRFCDVHLLNFSLQLFVSHDRFIPAVVTLML